MANVTIQEALQSALEAMEYHTEQTRPIQKTIDTLALCKAALAEIETCEPVGITENLFEDNDVWLSKLPVGTKLYATPQPRKWVSLTTQDRQAIIKASPHGLDRINATEAKLKQLNTKG